MICIYDIVSNPQTGTKLKKILRRYLFHIQNSVFEGTLTPKQFKCLKSEIQNTVSDSRDQVIFYYTYRDRDLYQETIGKAQEIKNII